MVQIFEKNGGLVTSVFNDKKYKTWPFLDDISWRKHFCAKIKTSCFQPKQLITMNEPKLLNLRSPENEETDVIYTPNSWSSNYIQIYSIHRYLRNVKSPEDNLTTGRYLRNLSLRNSIRTCSKILYQKQRFCDILPHQIL